MPKKITIVLEEKEFGITVPLTIGQLEDLQVATALPALPDPQENVRRDFQQSLGIIMAAVTPENPSLTEAALRAMRIPPEELNTAVSKILHESGLIRERADKAGATKPGEASAAAA